MLQEVNKYLATWDRYVRDLLSSTHVQKAAIYDLSGKKIASSSEDFDLSREEFCRLLNGFTNSSSLKKTGIFVSGAHYDVHLADGRYGILAKAGLGDSLRGCTVCKTHKLIIVGTHMETQEAAKCNEEIMRLGDFFLSKML